MEKAFAAVTFALLKQKDVLQSEIRKFLLWVYEAKEPGYNDIYMKLNEIFTSSEYTKVCSDALQLVCGHRAELVQHRREAILASAKDAYHKSALRKVPPSCSNLFDSEKFSAVIEKAGGMKNVFWPKQKDRNFAAQQKATEVASGFSRPSANHQRAHKPVPPPKQGNRYGHKDSSRGRHVTFRTSRGGGSQTEGRARSPSSHRDRRGQPKKRY